MDVCTVLRTYPNYDKFFERLTWRNCEEEYNQNVKLYATDKMAVPFQSGTDKEHQEWEDLMEEIMQHIEDKDVLEPSKTDHPP